jgi:hypothetical protein
VLAATAEYFHLLDMDANRLGRRLLVDGVGGSELLSVDGVGGVVIVSHPLPFELLPTTVSGASVSTMLIS